MNTIDAHTKSIDNNKSDRQTDNELVMKQTAENRTPENSQQFPLTKKTDGEDKGSRLTLDRTDEMKSTSIERENSFHCPRRFIPYLLDVEAVEVHNFGPRCNEVVDKLVLDVGAAVDFRERAEL